MMHSSKSKSNKDSTHDSSFHAKSSGNAIAQFIDKRPATLLQQKHIDNSPQSKQLKAYQDMADASGQVVQLKIHHNKSQGFFGDEARPGWRKKLKEYAVEDYNTKNGTAFTISTIDLGKLHLDRCHIVAFSVIQGWLLSYLNGSMTKDVFKTNTDALYRADAPEISNMKAIRELLFKATTIPDKLAKARGLLSYLNSAVGNVYLGNDSVNRGIGNKLDPNFVKKGSKLSATPNSKRVMKLGKKYTGGVAMSPGGKSVRSSRAAGGKASRVLFSPDSKKAVDNNL